MPVEQQVFIIWTVSNGLADDIEVSDLRRFEEEIFKFIENAHPSVLQTLRDKKSIDDDLKASMREAVEDFKQLAGNGGNANQTGGAIIVENAATANA
jgi:F-type H+-transporting ATPase subunit alpha